MLPDLIEIKPLEKPVKAEITVPGSKSITNRALVLAALAEGTTRLEGVLESDDTRYMQQALLELGIAVRKLSPTTLEIDGGRGRLKALSGSRGRPAR